MTKNHKETILHFIAYTGVYVQLSDKINVISFITGYEIGSNNECDLTTILSEYIDNKYKIKRNSIGWPGPVQQYSENNNLNWVDAFKQLTREVLLL